MPECWVHDREWFVIGIDVDNYDLKRGGQTLVEGERRWGALPSTYTSTSRDDGISKIRLCRIPKDIRLRGCIAFPDLELGDIEIIQPHHRYLVCWPSIHPDSGKQYLWRDPIDVVMSGPPPVSEIPELPVEWLEALRDQNKTKGSTKARPTEGSALAECPYVVEQCLTGGEMSAKVAKRLGEAIDHCHSGSRHDLVLKDSLALLRFGKRGEAGVFKAMSALGWTFIRAVAGGQAEAETEFLRMLSNEGAARLLAGPDGNEVDEIGMDDGPKRWSALDLAPAEQPRWLADSRLPRAATCLLLGDEGIGKSLFWVRAVAHITTGAPFVEFGIPPRSAGRATLVLTEDDWSTVVRPRLEIAKADLGQIDVICVERDGSGSPIFPRDIALLDGEPKPDIIVVDCWLDTVPSNLRVADLQHARQALHPWKEIVTRADASVLLIGHTNRVQSPHARDRYGATYALRQKARMTLFAQQDRDGHLVVGPEKANGAPLRPASKFSISGVPFLEPNQENDGTVPLLAYAGESDRTSRQHLEDSFAELRKGADKPDPTLWQAFGVTSHLSRNRMWGVVENIAQTMPI